MNDDPVQQSTGTFDRPTQELVLSLPIGSEPPAERTDGAALSESDIETLAVGREYGFVESFSGPGGMSLGLDRAKLKLLLAFDYDSWAVTTHSKNLGGLCRQLDASKVTSGEILDITGLDKGQLALFTGGPPCQGFSKQKRGAHLGDDRNKLVLDFLRLTSEIAPRMFVFENVAIFGQKRGREYVGEMAKMLGSEYILYPHFYNAADYGLAQTRQRFIVVGKRRDQTGVFELPASTVRTWKTVGEVIGDLPEPPEDYSHHPAFPNHQRARVTEINIRRFSYVPEGGGWQNIPEHLRLDCHKGVDVESGGWPDVYGRLKWDGQCPTITGGFDSFTRGRYGHPKQDRPLTPREAARLQGFPDDFVFYGTRGDIRSQLGNAVPPPLAAAVGREIVKCLLRSDGLLHDARGSGEQFDFALGL